MTHKFHYHKTLVLISGRLYSYVINNVMTTHNMIFLWEQVPDNNTNFHENKQSLKATNSHLKGNVINRNLHSGLFHRKFI